MTAQGIEAATADKTRSGLAEGESPFRQDASNPLYQEGYSMVDTTDQQAVTVAQPSDAATRLAITATPETFPRDSYELAQWIDRGLASVSSASADWTRTKAFDEAAAECMRAAEASMFDDTVSEDERKGYRSACNLMAMNFRLMASYAAPEWLTPEPVPATNQAGEVERLPKLKTGYPDYVDDPDGLDRFRQQVLRENGHDMAVCNNNSLGRLLDTIERLRTERDAALAIQSADLNQEDAACWRYEYRDSTDKPWRQYYSHKQVTVCAANFGYVRNPEPLFLGTAQGKAA